ncbi:hypothetical protein O181_037692 [Austropuccinia psidii MF-1]|uniref:Uncharacterized protein n=1 Tax=Austropuccinia psidii MF-1 TaxID=1389203 RepID=A0A9Q3D9I1_9BASI|nr:hypothetical protein [Austropuccinia psidii MF-1]
MEAAIQSNQMDLDNEEVRPKQGLPSLPQERHIWNIPELLPFPKSIKGRGVGNIPKPLAEGLELLTTHQELPGSGEDHRTLRRVEPIVLQIQVQKGKEFVEEPKSFIFEKKKELEMTPGLEEGPMASTRSKPAPEASNEKSKGPEK